MFDVVIIGGGPAGLTAAIYAMRARLHAVLIENGGLGGQILTTYEVDNYPGMPGISGMELGQKMREHAEKLGIEILNEQVTGILNGKPVKTVITTKRKIETKTIIIATGTRHAHLNVSGEEELAGMGVSYCATCDGAFYRDADVAVVGGGDVAAEDAVFLARGCRKVYLIHRRDKLRAAAYLQEALKDCPNVEMVWNSEVVEIEGEDGCEVSGIVVQDKQTGEERRLEVEGIFIAVGVRPDTAVYEGLVEMDKDGYIVAGEDCRSSQEGIFAAGDIRTKSLRQIITAAADGAMAVTGVQTYLRNGREM